MLFFGPEEWLIVDDERYGIINYFELRVLLTL
jgi:hypothetical protein